ncbi:hypothetical protein OG592_41870 (plasmid) [Streptomyces avidinii]|uniref:hypothetical protein n=1 Tax=Streptomyces avidinii TaxID=1895 RepID=UPI002F9163FC|nr:hypothetical protein OG592_41870 [Streptomyces avidinii]
MENIQQPQREAADGRNRVLKEAIEAAYGTPGAAVPASPVQNTPQPVADPQVEHGALLLKAARVASAERERGQGAGSRRENGGNVGCGRTVEGVPGKKPQDSEGEQGQEHRVHGHDPICGAGQVPGLAPSPSRSALEQPG